MKYTQIAILLLISSDAFSNPEEFLEIADKYIGCASSAAITVAAPKKPGIAISEKTLNEAKLVVRMWIGAGIALSSKKYAEEMFERQFEEKKSQLQSYAYHNDADKIKSIFSTYKEETDRCARDLFTVDAEKIQSVSKKNDYENRAANNSLKADGPDGPPP